MALSTCGPGHRQGWEAMADGSGAWRSHCGARLFRKRGGGRRRSVALCDNHAQTWTFDAQQQVWRLRKVYCNPPRLVFGEQLGG
jgi:hypothetical protein